ncbi:hypothetical protein BX600DRAFT_459433 [Xylariales sp. PMI_506]|nr:hypothetical protein BX600DRAFT_459433 [Xylariales sp. PMI_506]
MDATHSKHRYPGQRVLSIACTATSPASFIAAFCQGRQMGEKNSPSETQKQSQHGNAEVVGEAAQEGLRKLPRSVRRSEYSAELLDNYLHISAAQKIYTVRCDEYFAQIRPRDVSLSA